MADEYDVIVVGGGHNGLTTACYLAKQGLSCLVLERNELLGGGAMTQDFPGAPGYRHNTHAQMMMWLEAGPVYQELELERHGCEIVPLEVQAAHVFQDGPPLLFYRDIDRTCETIARYSKRDAETYRQISEQAGAAAPMFLISLFNLPAPPSVQSAALEGDVEGLEFLRMQMSTPDQVVDEYFESDQIKAFLLSQVLQVASGTDRHGAGGWPFSLIGLEHHPAFGMGVAKGGTIAVADALRNYLEQHGGKAVTGAHVDRILIEGERATGVRLSDGTEFRANQAVVAGAGHWQLVFDLVPAEDWPEPEGPEFVNAIHRFRPDELAIFTTHLALEERPHWEDADEYPELDETVCVFWGLEDPEMVRSQVEDVRAQRLARHPGGATCTHTVADPTLNPGGGHSSFVWQMSVYDVDGDAQAWDRGRSEEFGEQIIATWRKYAPNLNGDNIRATVHYSPLDLERRTISMYEGSMSMGDLSQDQMGSFRPAPGWADYRTPVSNLYVSSGTGHPMGGVMGAAGRNCATVLAEDLNLERWWPDFSG